ncbi:MAG: HD-GYP domain-containing protein [Trueperaceae bacterium]
MSVPAFLARNPFRGRPAPWATVALAVAPLACLALTAALVHATGGTRGPYLHLAYLPIVLAATLFGPAAGIAVGVAATLTVGPWMPLDVAAGVPQPTAGWLFRGAFFVTIGGVAGVTGTVVRAHAGRAHLLRQRLADTYGRNLRVFAHLVEARDEQTHGHCDRVARNAVAIGDRLGLDEETLGRLFWAGLLHDLGKIEVPEAILRKPGPLTTEERRIMERHSEAGYRILHASAPEFSPIAEGLRSHHERFDGAGYPRGLAGTAIPLFGRILAVADVYEAITSHRPYRSPMTHDQALQVLKEGRGRHFDPEILDAFLETLRSGSIRREEDGAAVSDVGLGTVLDRPDRIGAGLLFGSGARSHASRPS